MPNKTKVHTVYKLKSGERVPSVTTVLNILAKPALLEWAWQMGTQGLDYKAVRDAAGDIGTLVHYLILCDLKKEKPDLTEFSPADIEKTETCLLKYREWLKQHQLETLLIETPLVSGNYGYGGTPDWFGRVDADLTLVDYKTGKAIYPEQLSQVAAYVQLLKENGYGAIRKIRLLRIGRDETEGYEEQVIEDDALAGYMDIFLACLKIYNKRRELKL